MIWKRLEPLKRKHRGYGDTFYIDEVFVKINGKPQYLWRAVAQDGLIGTVIALLGGWFVNRIKVNQANERMEKIAPWRPLKS